VLHQVAKLVGFETDASNATLPNSATLQNRERTVSRLISSLEGLYNEDVTRYEGTLISLQQLVTSGGAAASDSVRRARALAQLAGCEPTPTIELLCALGMSTHGAAELKVLKYAPRPRSLATRAVCLLVCCD
jgi:hypothetical protein